MATSRPAGSFAGASMSFSQPQGASVTPDDDQRAWTQVCRRLRAELGEDVYASWFARLELESAVAGTARVTVPTKFLKSWITSHYMERIRAVMAAEMPQISEILIAVRTSARAPAPRPAPREDASGYALADPAATHRNSEAGPSVRAGDAFRAPATETAATDDQGLAGSPLDRRLSFETFVVGSSNRLAHAAAMRLAEAGPGEALPYNPFYIHAAVGLGKTHLVQALAHACAQAGRRVIYLTAEKFMHVFAMALRAQNAMAFKDRLRAIDVLVIDDVQFLQGKSMQQEFCHTLNALIDSGRQIVIAADRPPSDLESLDERVRSRLAGGLCVEMGALEEPLRQKILEMRVAAARRAQSGFDLSPAVISYLAHVIDSNGRDLDGAVNRLMAHAMIAGTPVTVDSAEMAIRDLIRTREPRRVKIEDIQKLVATHYNVSRQDILSSRRTAIVVRPRQIAMYLAKVLTLRSFPEIGRRFGGRDHTTVLHAVRKIEQLAAKDAPLSEELELLKRMLTE